jgi:hypothetical protein
MRCFHAVHGHVAMVAVLPQSISDEEAIVAGRAAFGTAAAVDRLDGFEIWTWKGKVYESAEVPRALINDRPTAAGLQHAYAAKAVRSGISSVITLNLVSWCGPNDAIMGMSAASRPRAIRMRPIRRALWRGSKVYHRPPM